MPILSVCFRNPFDQLESFANTVRRSRLPVACLNNNHVTLEATLLKPIHYFEVVTSAGNHLTRLVVRGAPAARAHTTEITRSVDTALQSEDQTTWLLP
jgi:hypothetical protein